MPLPFDDSEIPIPCPLCGTRTPASVAAVRIGKDVQCSKCGAFIAIDDPEIRRAVFSTGAAQVTARRAGVAPGDEPPLTPLPDEPDPTLQ